MVHAYKFPTVTALHDGLARKLLYGTRDELDDANSVDVQLHNVTAYAKSFEWDYRVDRLWTTHQRWNRMVRQYINRDDLEEWLDLIGDRFPSSKRGIAVLRTNTVQSRQTGRGTIRRWGSCMLSLSFRMKPWPQITLHSRTCYLGYLSVLDLSVAYVCAQLVSERVGIPVRAMSFMWSLEMAQFHGFRCLAFPLGDEDEADYFLGHDASKAEYPGAFITRNWYNRIAQMDKDHQLYGDMTFSSFKRVRRRWHTQMFGEEYASQFGGGTYSKDGRVYKPIPALHVDELDFSALYRETRAQKRKRLQDADTTD